MRRKCMPSEVREVPVANPDPVSSAVFMYLFITMPCSGNHEQCHGVLIVENPRTPFHFVRSVPGRVGASVATRGDALGERVK